MMSPIEESSIAPEIDLPRDGGGHVRLGDFKGQKVVLYFYPADDTSGCTLEALDFTRHLPEFEKAGAVVVGVSPDSEQSHDKFKAKHSLSIILAADVDRTVIESFGLWVEKQMYGRKFMGVERATFLIAPDGRIAKIWRNVKVKGHVDEVLSAAQALQ